jgi:hypothetical protein
VKNINSTIVTILSMCVFLGSVSLAQVAVEQEEGVARQVRINKGVLISGLTEQERLDAAMELLASNSQSRAVLLEVLSAEDNPLARKAICRALVTSRSKRQSLKDRGDFLEPLLGMLINLHAQDAQLAAQALLIYDYSEVASRLSKLVHSTELERQFRLNLIYALKGWSTDKGAISELVMLLDDNDSEIATAAKEALPYWVPADEDRRKILRKLKSKSTSDIIKEQLEVLEEQKRLLQIKSVSWEKLYFGLLDEKYDAADEAVRGQILLERLTSDIPAVKLWSLKQMSQDNLALWPEGLGRRLLEMVSDNDRDVRLLTAEILLRRSNLNPAQKLLAQFRAEQDADVRLAIFEALGEACKFAFSPGTEVELSVEVRNETLEIAAEYVAEGGDKGVNSGAEVIQKLLELNNIEDSLVQKYLTLIFQRYEKASSQQGHLRGELLLVMAKLCAQGSHSNAAGQLFNQVFIAALDLKDQDVVREAAVVGLINTDKVAALEMFKQKGLIGDSSPTVVAAIIELAAEVGQFGDIEWLKAKVDSNSQGDLAWAAVIKILQRQEAPVIIQWAITLEQAGVDGHYSDVLEVAENKAQLQGNGAALQEARLKLSDWYEAKGQHDKSIEYCGKLLEMAGDDLQIIEKAELGLVKAYLARGDVGNIAQVVTGRLARGPLGQQDSIAAEIDKFLTSDAAAEQKKPLLNALAAIKFEGDRPQWSQRLGEWQKIVVPPTE